MIWFLERAPESRRLSLANIYVPSIPRDLRCGRWTFCDLMFER